MGVDSEEPVVTHREALEHLLNKGTDRLKEQLKEGVVTPIELAKAVGVKPQMIYNYIRNNRIVAHKTSDTQKIVIDVDVAMQFVRERLGKDAKKALKIQAELEGVRV